MTNDPQQPYPQQQPSQPYFPPQPQQSQQPTQPPYGQYQPQPSQPQQSQQWDQQQWDQRQGVWQQHAAPVQPPKEKRSGSGNRLWLGILIGAVAAAIIVVPVTLLSVGKLFTPTLDQGALQRGVAKVLQADFGLTDADAVSCPSGQPVAAGTEFECTFSYNKTTYPVSVEVLNDDGQYRVGIDAPKKK